MRMNVYFILKDELLASGWQQTLPAILEYTIRLIHDFSDEDWLFYKKIDYVDDAVVRIDKRGRLTVYIRYDESLRYRIHEFYDTITMIEEGKCLPIIMRDTRQLMSWIDK